MIKLVVDCNNLGFAAAYTTGGLSYQAVPTGVVFGFLGQIYKLAEKFKTNKFIFCWDSRRSFRKMIYPAYKENRRRDLTFEEQRNLKIVYQQFDELYSVILPSMGFKNVFRRTGYEADDLIAYIVQRLPDKYIVVSSDNDLWQLIDKGRKGSTFVKIYSPRSNKLWDYSEFMSKWSIEPYRWAEVKAIAGCATDGVEGVDGVGEVTAIKYVTNNLTKGKKYDKIEQSKDIIRTNRRLVTLPFAGRVPIGIDRLKWEMLWTLDFIDVFSKYGFGSFLKEDRFEKWVELFSLNRGRGGAENG